MYKSLSYLCMFPCIKVLLTPAGFSIEGPSQAKIDCKDNGDGSADVTYFPTAPGEYAVHVLCNEEDIPKSPYMAQIVPPTQYWAGKVCLCGVCV